LVVIVLLWLYVPVHGQQNSSIYIPSGGVNESQSNTSGGVNESQSNTSGPSKEPLPSTKPSGQPLTVDSTVIAAIVTAIAGATGAGGYFGGKEKARADKELGIAQANAAKELEITKSKLEFESKLNEQLRKLRVEHYGLLFTILQPLKPFGRAEQFSYSNLEILRKALISWYYGPGGMVLSTSSRPCFENLLNAVDNVIKDMESHNLLTVESSSILPVAEADGELRKKLLDDVGIK
jgi:hypothetical protein